MHVSALYCYPIKSCGGFAIATADVTLRGIPYDREWAIIDLWTRKVLTQREVPKLCLIKARIDGDILEFGLEGERKMRLEIDDASTRGGERRIEAEIHGERAEAIDQGVWACGWLTAFLGRDCALIRMPWNRMRPSAGGGGRAVAFADAHEVLAVSEASLADLNGRMETPLPMERFRPNIVVAGADPYAEDGWGDVRIGGSMLRGAKRCVRCVITTTDQATAARGKEPLATLATYRKIPKGVVFGRYFDFVNGGRLSVGDVIEIIA